MPPLMRRQNGPEHAFYRRGRRRGRKTTNGGTSWSPLTDNVTSGGTPVPLFMGVLAETRDASNNEIVYAGTGEANNSGDSFYG